LDTGFGIRLPRFADRSLSSQTVAIPSALIPSSVSCEICYVALEDQEGEQTFQCRHCSKVFHEDCVRDWCQALPNVHRSYEKVFGNCPSCDGVSEMRTCLCFTSMCIEYNCPCTLTLLLMIEQNVDRIVLHSKNKWWTMRSLYSLFKGVFKRSIGWNLRRPKLDRWLQRPRLPRQRREQSQEHLVRPTNH
jgi:hypothetical protein